MKPSKPRLHAVPPPIAGRVPPNDLDSEAAVLGAVLLGQGLDRLADRLSEGDFYASANGRIFAAAIELWAAGKPVDIVTVAGVLRDREVLRSVGGAEYLAQLSDATPHIEHLEAYADRVVEKARLRAMIATCQRLTAEGYGDIGPAREWLDAAEGAVCEVSRKGEVIGLEPAGRSVKTMFARIAAAAEAGETLTGVSTGYTHLDKKLGGLQPGNFIVCAARPGMGKSAFALNVAVNVASPREVSRGNSLCTVPGGGVLMLSLEMTRDELAMRAVCSEARANLGRLREGKVLDHEWPKLVEASSYIASIPLHWDDTGGLSPLDVRARVRRGAGELSRRGTPLKLVIVDYVQLMNAKGMMRESENREREISIVSNTLKTFAKEQNVPILALAQLNRLVEYRGGKDKRPRLADIRESGSLEQDADVVLFVHRERYYDDTAAPDEAEIIIAKQRNGPTGIVKLQWTGSCCRFDNPPPSWATTTEEAAAS